MKDDHELLDSALDSAIEELDTRSKSEAESVDTKDVPVTDGTSSSNEAPESKEAESKETDLDQESVETAEPEGTAEARPPANPPLAAPVHWSPERAAVFAKIPREGQEIILAREQELERKLQQATTSGGRAFEQRIYSDFDSPEAVNLHRAKLHANGIADPIQELHRYRAWDRVLESDPYSAIQSLMQKNGFTPNDFLGGDVGQPENQYQDPRVEDALKRAEAAEKRIQDFEQKQETARLGSVVNAFKSGNFEDGTPRAKFVTVYAPQISQAYDTLAQNPDYQHLGEQDLLHYATEFVRSQVNELHGVKPAPKAPPAKTREQIIAESKKAQAAATATTGAPNTVTLANKRSRLKGKNESERVGSAVDIALDRAYGVQ